MIFFDFAGTHLMMLAPSISLYFSKQVFGEAFLKNLLQLLFVGYKKNVFFFLIFVLPVVYFQLPFLVREPNYIVGNIIVILDKSPNEALSDKKALSHLVRIGNF